MLWSLRNADSLTSQDYYYEVASRRFEILKGVTCNLKPVSNDNFSYFTSCPLQYAASQLMSQAAQKRKQTYLKSASHHPHPDRALARHYYSTPHFTHLWACSLTAQPSVPERVPTQMPVESSGSKPGNWLSPPSAQDLTYCIHLKDLGSWKLVLVSDWMTIKATFKNFEISAESVPS